MKIAEILSKAETGELDSCIDCPWSPENDASVGFGVTCRTHGLNWKSEGRANSMVIVQDPGDTTPHETGRLCAVHNAENYSDKTAQNGLRLWNAAVSLSHDDPEAGGYMKQNYWANAIMHGASSSSGLRDKAIMEEARKSCTGVLESQIQAVKPKVLIAKGTTAVNSLYDLGLLNGDWSYVRSDFSEGAYHGTVEHWGDIEYMNVFCTYHTAARVVNQTVSRLYDPIETDALIEEKNAHIRSNSIEEFLYLYSDPINNATDRGMRVLLNHWLDIGVYIRDNK